MKPLPKIVYPPQLPIVDKRDEIVATIAGHQVVVVTGDTGSGKSTQLPKMCLEAGRGARGWIGCTQPRRIAAITLAQRVSEELGERFAGWVGYKIRFQDRTSRRTRVKFMTDGILLAETQGDRLFRAYDTIIVDEAHERSLNIDFLLGILRRNLERRPDLKVVITSATIDPEKFSQAFDNAPIIEVSGRTYPVRVWYRPLPEGSADAGEVTHIDQALVAVRELWDQRLRGDTLIFMPTESDIRETVARLEQMKLHDTVVLPLFGRLAAADQRRVFRRLDKMKIVVATNVAETSITIPGIRYVIDSGLARLSQYNVRSRTQGLPIVAISRASADQRKGRCGRVAPGLCVRLYSEQDYRDRPTFTAPEIQRSNLAEVILRMLYLKLGDVGRFPFLDPPSPAAVKDGFGVLRELGAVDEHRRLTRLGRTMARLPLDPRLSRMLVEARREKAVAELAVLCAALSIQDPRERPLEREKEADQVHNRIKDRRSDFVTLLKLWRLYQDQKKRLSHSRLRRFCRDNFLSYRRMREWQDIHHEVLELIGEIGGFATNPEPATYEALHRCICAGYLSHIGMRKEKNIYQAAKGRQVMIFPGSGLFNRGGEWIVAAELVQTSRLFARTVAVIEPQWLERLGRHLCRYSYSDPHWEKRRGQVVAAEQVTLYGLKIVSGRKVNYARICPREAREIFIRSALVEGELPRRYPFWEHNRDLLKEIEEMENKIRRRELLVDDEAVFRFYDERLPEIADIRSFDRWLKESGGDVALQMSQRDLLRTEPDQQRLAAFPDTLEIGELRLPVRYCFDPGRDEDGMTITVPVHVLARLDSDEPFQWLVPGMLPDKVTALLRALPKALRRHLVPIPETAARLLEGLKFRQGNLYRQMSRCLREITGVAIAAEEWERIVDQGLLARHLLPRFEVVADDGRVLGAARRLQEVQRPAMARHDDDILREARRRWERDGITCWDFGELPDQIRLGKDAHGVERIAWPAIVAEGDRAAVRLLGDPGQALERSRDGLLVLYQWALAPELKRLRKQWRFPAEPKEALFFLGNRQQAQRRLHLYILRELFGLQRPVRPERARFQEKLEVLRGKLGLESQQILEEVQRVIGERHSCRRAIEAYRRRAGGNQAVLQRLVRIEKELNGLVPFDFLDRYGRAEVIHMPRYLRALRIRAERAYVAPEKDRRKEQALSPYLERLKEMDTSGHWVHDPATQQRLDDFRWMVEEFKISCFAPEIKTRYPVSAKRLDEAWQRLEEQMAAGSR